MKETHLHTIRLDVDGNGDEQRKLAGEIRNRILAAGQGRAMKEAFEKEAKEHSMDPLAKKGGCWSWVQEDDLIDALAAEVAKVRDNSLSEVLDVRMGGRNYVFLIMVPDARRRVPFEKVQGLAYGGVYIGILFDKAQIDILEDPAEAVAGDQPEKEDFPAGIDALLERMMPAFEGLGRLMKSNPGDGGKEEIDDRHKELPLPQRVVRRAEEGIPADIYLLGTYTERGIAPRDNGMEKAVELYRMAADKGDVTAMLRLAHLHRIGRGVERDATMARQWKEKAAALTGKSAPEPENQ
jgi:hypothetical protein